MTKVNPNRYAVPVLPILTRDFDEPLQPGVTLSLSFHPMVGFTEFSTMLNKAAELKRKYVTGYEKVIEGEKKLVPPAPVIDGKNRIIVITDKTCEAAAQMLAMQDGPKADRYNEYEWLQNSGVFPSAFFQIFEFCLEVNATDEEEADTEDPEKKLSPPEEPFSEPIFGPQDITPESPSETTPSPSEPTDASPS